MPEWQRTLAAMSTASNLLRLRPEQRYAGHPPAGAVIIFQGGELSVRGGLPLYVPLAAQPGDLRRPA